MISRIAILCFCLLIPTLHASLYEEDPDTVTALAASLGMSLEEYMAALRVQQEQDGTYQAPQQPVVAVPTTVSVPVLPGGVTSVPTEADAQRLGIPLEMLIEDYYVRHPEAMPQGGLPVGHVEDDYTGSPIFIPSDDLRSAVLKAKSLYDTYTAANPTADVHVANRDCLRTIHSLLIAADPYPQNPCCRAREVIIALQAIDQGFSPVANKLKEYAQAGLIMDHETGASVPHLLSRVFELARYIPPHHIFTEARLDALHYLAWSLRENKETAGGCFAGFAGRLIRDYIEFLGILCAR